MHNIGVEKFHFFFLLPLLLLERIFPQSERKSNIRQAAKTYFYDRLKPLPTALTTKWALNGNRFRDINVADYISCFGAVDPCGYCSSPFQLGDIMTVRIVGDSTLYLVWHITDSDVLQYGAIPFHWMTEFSKTNLCSKCHHFLLNSWQCHSRTSKSFNRSEKHNERKCKFIRHHCSPTKANCLGRKNKKKLKCGSVWKSSNDNKLRWTWHQSSSPGGRSGSHFFVCAFFKSNFCVQPRYEWMNGRQGQKPSEHNFSLLLPIALDYL